MTTTQLATVEFHGQLLTVITGSNGEHLVAMKPICENIELQWEAQLKRIKRHPVLSSTMSMMDIVAEDGKTREVVCLPLDYLNGWLFGVDASRVKPEIRERLIQYQRECFHVLAAYWQQGEVSNPRKPKKPKALPNGLTTEQQEAIKGLVKARVDRLPQDKRAGAAVKCWSALKNKFGCTYKKIDPNQFTEAVSLVARIELEGEFLGKDDQPKLTPFAQIIGRPLKPIERWIVYTDGSDKEQYRPIPIDSFVMTPAKLLYVMANTSDAPIPTQELFDFVVAALSKLKAIRSAKAVPQEVFNEGAKMVAQRFLDGDFLGKEPKPKPITLNQLDLAMLYTFSSAAMQLCDMGERMKPAIEALRPMGLFGIHARLESCRLAVSHFYKQMGPQMEAAAQKEKLLNEWMDLGAAEDRSRPIIRG